MEDLNELNTAVVKYYEALFEEKEHWRPARCT